MRWLRNMVAKMLGIKPQIVTIYYSGATSDYPWPFCPQCGACLDHASNPVAVYTEWAQGGHP